jgi:hypothetical protein
MSRVPAALVDNLRQVLALPARERPTAIAQLRAAAVQRGLSELLETELIRAGLVLDPRQHVLGTTHVVHSFVADAFSPGNTIRRASVPGEVDERQLDWLLDENSRPLEHATYLDPLADRFACLSAVTMENVEQSTKSLACLDSFALLHFYARRVFLHHQHKSTMFDAWSSGEQFTDTFSGFEDLAAHIGVSTGGHARQRLEPVLAAHRALRGQYHGISLDGLVSFNYAAKRGSNSPMLLLTYLPPIRPSFIAIVQERLRGTLLLEAGQQLVQMVGLPPLFGRARDHAKQALAGLRLSAYMRRRADEFYERGGVYLGREELERIASSARFARRRIGATAADLLASWLRPSGATPALVAPVGSPAERRYRFADSHRDANIALHEAGKRVVRGRNNAAKRARGKSDPSYFRKAAA